MRRLVCLAALIGLALAGCGKQPPPSRIGGDPPSPEPANVQLGQPLPAQPAVLQPAQPAGPATQTAKPAEWMPAGTEETAKQEKYDAALLEALNLLAERKYPEALASLETARAIQDTEQVRFEIEKLKRVQEQQAAADRTVADIQVVLGEGRAEVAAHLATKALDTFGGTEAAFTLTKLKRQADALLSGQLEDNRARQTRFRAEADAALRDRNLRAAAIALEQVLAYGPDAELKRQADDIRTALARYDENRQKAAELRRDPYALEDAIAALQEAAKAWDTVQVRQEIDECSLLLQKRRDRLSVAEFEVRGEIGMPAAGRSVADELLPAFKSRFDLIERSQLGKVVDELKLQQTELLGNDNGRREVGKLAKVRYLVVGSITPMSGILVQARLVDVRTGLVVQTAKVIAPTPEEMFAQLPQLANVLLMSDEEKIRWEQQQAQSAKVAVQPVQPAPLPPPPEVTAPEQPLPPPIVVYTPRAPEFGGIKADDFRALPPPPPPGRPLPPPVVIVERERPIKQKMFHVAIELGDNLFRRGRYREAQTQFEFALNLEPGHKDISIRLERCRPYLPPPPPPPPVVVIVEAPPPPPPPRLRLAILNFAEIGNPAAVPPGLGAWTADHLGPYFCPPYDVVDRGEVFWWMGRLGLTVRDVVTDPVARRWLARAMNVRFFLFGSLTETASFVAETHLVDAEYGFEIGSGAIHVHNPLELKLRLSELARLTLMPPQERVVYVKQVEDSERILIEARRSSDRGEFAVALEFFNKAMKNRPGSIEIQVLIQKNSDRARQAELEAARRREWERQQALAAEMQRRQWEMARAAEAARIRAEQEAAAVAESQRLAQAQQRERAHQQLYVQAQVAFQQDNFSLSIQLFESALSLKQSDNGYRELALARAKAQETQRRKAAEEAARREQAVRVQREQELAQLRARVEAERQQREAAEQARRQSQETRDQAEYTRFIDQGQRQMAQQKYDDAVASFQAARQLKKTDEVEKLVTAGLVEQARATAQRKGQRERDELERRLVQEKAAREKAEAEAKRNQELYTAALAQAQKDLAQQQYEESIAKYHEAEKLYRTDVVLTGLRQAEDGLAKRKARAEGETRRKAEEDRKAEELRQKLSQAEAALAAKQYDRSLSLYGEALKLSPGNVDALAGQSKAQQLRDETAATVRREKDGKERQHAFRTLLASGKANLAAKQYDSAVLALSEAVKLNPADPEAKAALAEAQKGQSQVVVDAKAAAEAKKKADEYQKWMGEGRAALSAKQYDAAIRSFREASRVLPGDQSATAFLKEAEKGKADAAAAVVAETKRKEEEHKRAVEVQKLLGQGRSAMSTRDLDGADKAFQAAANLAPGSPDVAKAREDLQTARTVARAEAEGRRKKLGEYQTLVKKGRDALTAKRYDEAIQNFEQAAKVMPEDGTAQALQKQAEKGRDEVRAAETKAAAEKVRLEAEAVRKKQEEEQRRRAEEAKRQQEQDAARAAAKAASEAEAKRQQEEQRRKTEYDRLMNGGRAAMAAKRYDEAIKLFGDALKVMPGDAAATKAVEDARKALEASKVPAPPPPQPKPEAKPQPPAPPPQPPKAEPKPQPPAPPAPRPAPKPQPPAPMPQPKADPKPQPSATPEAKPQPPAPPAPRPEAKPQPPAPPPQPPKAEPKPQPPTPTPEPKPQPPVPPAPRPAPKPQPPAPVPPPRPEAKPQPPAPTPQPPKAEPKPQPPAPPAPKPEAKPQPPAPMPQPKADPKPQPPPKPEAKPQPPAPPAPAPAPANNDAEYAKQMEAGAALDRQRKPEEALKAYREALRLKPGDPKATVAASNAEFQQKMDAGYKALNQKRFPDAVKEFEAALKLQPNNQAAANGLKRAREGR